MNLKTLIVSAALGTAAMLAQSPDAHASTLNFYYSFTDTVGNVSGTVSGEVYGLLDNSVGYASTNVTVTSYPAGLTGLPPAPFSVPAYAASIGQSVVANSFDVTNGVVTIGSQYQVSVGYFDLNVYNYYNELFNPSGSLGVANFNGFNADGVNGVIFTPAPSSATPLPSTWTMLIAGLIGIGFMARRGSRRQSAALGAA